MSPTTGSQPGSSTEVSLGARGHTPSLQRAHAPPTTPPELQTSESKRLTRARGTSKQQPGEGRPRRLVFLRTGSHGQPFRIRPAKEESGERPDGPFRLSIVRNDACLRDDAVVSAEDGEGFPLSRIACGTEDLKPTNQQGDGRSQ